MSLYPAKSSHSGLTEGRPPRATKHHTLSVEDLGFALLKTKSFFAYVWSEVEKRADPTIPTMALTVTDGRYTVLYHPDWYHYYTIEEAQFVIAHELTHKIRGHHPTLFKILKQTPDKNRRQEIMRVANVAADCDVNSCLSQGFGYPRLAEAIYPDRLDLDGGKSFTWYLSELLKKADANKKKTGEFSLGDPKADERMGKGEEPSPQSTEAEGEGEGESPSPQAPSTPGHGWVEPKEGDELLEQEAQMADLERDTKETVQRVKEIITAQRKAGIRCGNLPGFAEELLATITPAPLSWETRLKRHIVSAQQKNLEYRQTKLCEERMLVGSGFGYHGSEEEQDRFQITVGVDTSGSMATEQVEEALSIIATLARSEDEMLVKIVQYDTTVHNVGWLKNRGKLKPRIYGRGGTDFNAFFEEVLHGKFSGKKFRPDLVINFTDGYACQVRGDLRFDTKRHQLLWVLTQHGQNPHPQWGKELRMKK